MISAKQSALLANIRLAKDTKKTLRFLTAYGLLTGDIDDNVEPINELNSIALKNVMIHSSHQPFRTIKTMTVFSDQIIAVYLE